MNSMLPLVSILLPTYNRPEFFRLALESALKQTYGNIEIIIGDDSTNSATEKLVNLQFLRNYSNIAYYHNDRNLGQFDNDLKLLSMSNGEYINFLMDDDLFAPTKIETMMAFFLRDQKEELSLATSHRGVIDENGIFHGVYGNTQQLFSRTSIVNSVKLGNFMLMNNINCIGEPTTVLFKKNRLSEPFGMLNGRKSWCNVDLAAWYNLLSGGKAVFISEVLSWFRIHSGQQLGSTKMRLLGAADYVHEVLTARQKGFLQEDNELYRAMQRCLAHSRQVMSEVKQIGKVNKLKEEFYEFETSYEKLVKSMSVLAD